MRIINELPRFLDCLRAWEEPPGEEELRRRYLDPLAGVLAPLLDDFGRYGRPGLHRVVEGLDWPAYRWATLALDAAREEARLRRAIEGVERLLGVRLAGEAVLFGAFTLMDGYARFDRGGHRVFLAVDESFAKGRYLDVLMTHELTHVARESQPAVWMGWDLDPAMTHDAFTERQPVLEHLFAEGYSCAVSEALVPGEPPASYVYQTPETLARILTHGPAVDRVVHGELEAPDGHYGRLYDVTRYELGARTRERRRNLFGAKRRSRGEGPRPGSPRRGGGRRPPATELPRYVHYTWAWAWVKRIISERAGGDPKRLLGLCSRELRGDALAFRLRDPRSP